MPTTGQVLSKRRKVVCDMIENVVIDFKRGLQDKEWAAFSPRVRDRALKFLEEKALGPLTMYEPDYYNDDAKLGAAINKVVFRANAVSRWCKGTAALTALCGDEQGAGALFEHEALELAGKAKQELVLDGVGALLVLGKLKRLNLKESKLGAAEARRLALELSSWCQLEELE